MIPEGGGSYLSCPLTAEEVRSAIKKKKPTAVYLTSPDYLGKVADVKAIAEVCKSEGVLLLVDNAHGAYLKFLSPSLHPLDLGAHICCDSAHKTLPVLTGGAYLHIAKDAPEIFTEEARHALSLFGSTSPSYLILESLDLANKYMAEGFGEKLSEFSLKADELKVRLRNMGFALMGDEPMKLTVYARSYGYTGEALALEISERGG
jgi:arginine/lysine/ornithine decarboxylase